MLFPPHHGDSEQARLMSDPRIIIKAEGESYLLSKCCITSKCYNGRWPHGLDQCQGSFVLAKTYHAVIPRRSAGAMLDGYTQHPGVHSPTPIRERWTMKMHLPSPLICLFMRQQILQTWLKLQCVSATQ